MQTKQLRKQVKKEVKAKYLSNYIIVLIVTLFLVGTFTVINQTPGIFIYLKWFFLFTIFAPLFFIGSIKFLVNVTTKHKLNINDLIWSFRSKKRYFETLKFLVFMIGIIAVGWTICYIVGATCTWIAEITNTAPFLWTMLTFLINAVVVVYLFLTFSPFPFFFVIDGDTPTKAFKESIVKMKGKRLDYLAFHLSFGGWLLVVLIIILMFASLLGITFLLKTSYLYMLSVTIFTYVTQITVASFVYYYAACLTMYFKKYIEN